MPKNVVLFERLMYASIAIGLLETALDPESISAAADTVGVRFFIAVVVGGLAISVLLIWLVARKRKGWARLVILVMFVVGLPLSLLAILQKNPLAGASEIVMGLMQMAALYFCFTGDAKDWFRKPATPEPVPQPDVDA